MAILYELGQQLGVKWTATWYEEWTAKWLWRLDGEVALETRRQSGCNIRGLDNKMIATWWQQLTMVSKYPSFKHG
jgi:hypothetical protein